MFSWFKAKTPEPRKTWEISVNGFGEYSVKYLLGSPYEPPQLQAANRYFKGKVFANEIQCEKAIAKWEEIQKLDKKTHVKYL